MSNLESALPGLPEDGNVASNGRGSFDTLLDVSMPVSIEIGRTTLTVQDVLHLTPGSVVELDRAVGDPVDVLVGDRRIAEGEVVVIGDRFGVRISKLCSDAKVAA